MDKLFMRYLILLSAVAFLVSACGGFGDFFPRGKADNNPDDARERKQREGGTIFDEGGLFEGAAFTVGGQRIGPQQGGGIGVNAYLWHATLETVNFLPLHQVDPFGGVILTDWHSPANNPRERIKLNIFIVGKALRSDAVTVALFRETLQDSNWVSVESSPEVVRKIENAILERARERRLQAIGSPQ